MNLCWESYMRSTTLNYQQDGGLIWLKPKVQGGYDQLPTMTTGCLQRRPKWNSGCPTTDTMIMMESYEGQV